MPAVDLTGEVIANYKPSEERLPGTLQPEPGLRPKATVAGHQGRAVVIQHESGEQSVVVERGLKDAGLAEKP
jgi:hypothetical protein